MAYPEQIYFNGSVYTGSERQAQALAISNQHIVAIGQDAEICALAGPETVLVDLAGKLLIPGFIDSHLHPLEGQQMVGDTDPKRAETAEGVLAMIKEYAENHQDEKWVFIGGIDLSVFSPSPCRQLLDNVLPDRPLLVLGHDVHSGILNSAGLKAAGIGPETPDPSGGIYEREEQSLQPNGVVHEAALYRLFSMIPQLSAERYPQSLARARAMAHHHGITGWFDARVDEGLLKAYAAARDRGELKIYVSAGLLAIPAHDAEEQITRFLHWRQRYEGDTLRLHTVKLFIDGVVESKTAALLAPYADGDGNGLALWQQDALNQMVTLADQAGFDVHFHTVGDRATRMALDALEYASQHNGVRERRAQLAHLQLIDPADIPRFAPLGAIASVQTFWTAASSELQQFYSDTLGPERASRSYSFRSLHQAGAMLSGGSDWPVSSMNPLEIIQTSVTHRLIDDPQQPEWNPAQRLDLPTMLDAHTINSSYALRFDQQCGALEPGKEANFVILDRNIFNAPVESISQARVVTTCFRGEVVFSAKENQTDQTVS
jgi:predicted amidohydrolase YtcJ